MDRDGANFLNAVETVKTRLGGNCHPIQLNIGAEGDFQGLVDLIEMKAYIYNGDATESGHETPVEIPAELVEEATMLRQNLIEAVASFDDELMMMALEGQEPSQEQLKAAIRKATLTSQFFPAVCGSSYKNKGVKKMIDAVVDYLPSPLEVPAIKGTREDGTEVVRESSDAQPFSALAFKIMNDPFVGSLTFFRVYSGSLEKGSYVYNTTKGKKERISRILEMHANQRNEIEGVFAGDIAAAVGLKDTTTGDTLIAENDKDIIVLEKMEFPEPVIQLALEPASKAAVEKLSIGLQRLAAEDPTFRT